MIRKLSPWVVSGLAVGAAWCAVRYSWFMPLAWLVLVVATLWVSTPILADSWTGLVFVLLASSWLVACDHELAARLSLTLLAAVVAFAVSRSADLRRCHVSAVAVGVALTGVVALLQWAGGLEAAASAVSTLPPYAREAAAARLAGGRVFGTAALPGHFAVLELMAMPLLVGEIRNRGPLRLPAAVALVVSTAAAAATESFGWIVVAMALVAMLVVGGSRRSSILLTVIIALLALAAITVLLRTDMMTWTPIRLRLLNWQAAASAFAGHPLLGVGLGGIGQAVLEQPIGALNITPYAHNSVLQLVAELGLAGFAAVGLGIYSLIRVLGRGLSVWPELALAAAVVPLHNLMDFSLYTPEVVVPWAILLGVLVRRVCGPPRAAKGRLVVVAAAGALLVAVIAWQAEAGPSAVRDRAYVERELRAAVLAPWTVAPLYRAAETALALGSSPELVSGVEKELATRWWVQPRSAGYAEVRALLLLARGSRGEALVWAEEARRRAPWRRDFATLIEACR